MKALRSVRRRGMILLNVLFLVAVSATVVMLMITAQDVAIDRTVRLREAAQAAAYARSGELSAVVALRRDGVQAPGLDHRGEAWGAVEDDNVAIEGGRFSLSVTDAQARFNINNLSGGNVSAVGRLSNILAAAGLPPDLLAPIATYVRFAGPISDVRELAVAIPPQQFAALAPYITALPGGDVTVNVNAADERMLAVLFDSPIVARLLVSTRDRKGYLTPQDMTGANAILPNGVGYTSNFYEVRTDVTIGETRQILTSSLMRRPVVADALVSAPIAGGPRVEVLVYARKRTAAEPVEVPPRR